jgi:S-adenosylmethionine hydrolase
VTASVVTLLTDFGLRDGYVGAMKGTLLSRCPGVQLIDLSHEIPPGGIDAGAYVLRQAAPWFPNGTVHVAVVDPGVGSSRRAVLVQTERHCFVAPDNGLLTLALADAPPLRVHVVENPGLWLSEISPVFHGRDVFAPLAAHVASGGDLDAVGPAASVDSLVCRPWPEPGRGGDSRKGAVVYVDRFGNVVTNLPVQETEVGIGTVDVAWQRVSMAQTYSDVGPGEFVAVRGSTGLLEVACRDGNAAERLGAEIGSVVTWNLRARS